MEFIIAGVIVVAFFLVGHWANIEALRNFWGNTLDKLKD